MLYPLTCMPSTKNCGGQAGRPQRGNAGGGLATALIITADMTAFRTAPC